MFITENTGLLFDIGGVCGYNTKDWPDNWTDNPSRRIFRPLHFLGTSVFTLETDNPSKTGYPCSMDNPSLCEYGTVFILDGYSVYFYLPNYLSI